MGKFVGLMLILAPITGAQAQDVKRPEEFDRRDANHDRRLSLQEYGGHQGNFKALDCNRDGALDKHEFVDRPSCPEAPAAPSPSVVSPSPSQPSVVPPIRFDGLDTNKDGVLSRREWRHDSVAFHRADRNGDGVVTRAEDANLPDAAPEEARFDRADTDGNGVLSRREWPEEGEIERLDRNGDKVVSLQEFLRPPPASFQEAAFEDMDHNTDGVITRREWHGDAVSFERRDRNDDSLVTAWEFANPAPAQVGEAAFRDRDTNNDGRVSRSEWRGDPESFLLLDDDRDGSLSFYEYGQARSVDRRFRTLDRDEDGVVSRDEWLGDSETFVQLDRNRNGVLTREEFPNP